LGWNPIVIQRAIIPQKLLGSGSAKVYSIPISVTLFESSKPVDENNNVLMAIKVFKGAVVAFLMPEWKAYGRTRDKYAQSNQGC